ncbi:rod shape-determining protein MreC [Rubrobacter calidifluminis]|uniref:rod shape-determining protein MreC n=1 Tax=Rubrobacter calidifluminis TaxID=1392640 RepID=UPI00235E35C5|nr:rod shape-determining protein MreC [Rubrobacter calidifluminis]
MGRRKRSRSSGGLPAFIILLVASAVLFTVYTKEGDSGPLHTVQLGAAEVLRPGRTAVAAVSHPFKTAGDALSGVFGGGRASSREVRRLRQKNEALSARVAALTRQNDRLRTMLKGSRPNYRYAPLAQVISPIGGQFTDRVMINVGSSDGVRPGQPVVVGDNILVGRTAQVSANTAEVILVTDQSFKAGVEIVPRKSGGSGSAPEGLLEASYEGYLGVDYVNQSAHVRPGDYVITSGRAGSFRLMFPQGLLVGRVKSVSSQDINQYKKIVVAPAVHPDDLEEVRVITGW